MQHTKASSFRKRKHISNYEHQLSFKTLPFLHVLLVHAHKERLTPAIYKPVIQTGIFYETAKYKVEKCSRSNRPYKKRHCSPVHWSKTIHANRTARVRAKGMHASPNSGCPEIVWKKERYLVTFRAGGGGGGAVSPFNFWKPITNTPHTRKCMCPWRPTQIIWSCEPLNLVFYNLWDYNYTISPSKGPSVACFCGLLESEASLMKRRLPTEVKLTPIPEKRPCLYSLRSD